MRNTNRAQNSEVVPNLPNSHPVPVDVSDAKGVVAHGEAELLDRRGHDLVRRGFGHDEPAVQTGYVPAGVDGVLVEGQLERDGEAVGTLFRLVAVDDGLLLLLRVRGGEHGRLLEAERATLKDDGFPEREAVRSFSPVAASSNGQEDGHGIKGQNEDASQEKTHSFAYIPSPYTSKMRNSYAPGSRQTLTSTVA